MFVEFSWHRNNTEDNTYSYELVDSDFRERGRVKVSLPWIEIVDAIVDIYDKRKLNVAVNIAYALNWYNRDFGHLLVAMIADNKDNPNYLKYKEQIEKYMVLI